MILPCLHRVESFLKNTTDVLLLIPPPPPVHWLWVSHLLDTRGGATKKVHFDGSCRRFFQNLQICCLQWGRSTGGERATFRALAISSSPSGGEPFGPRTSRSSCHTDQPGGQARGAQGGQPSHLSACVGGCAIPLCAAINGCESESPDSPTQSRKPGGGVTQVK